MGEFLGKAVTNGTLRYLSVSALEKGSPLHDGCLRRYWYRYVDGRSEEESAAGAEAKAKGIALHKELENYQKTGVRSLSSLALKGLHFVPPPGADMVVAQPIHTVVNGEPVSDLTAAGVPVIGELDCAHERGINYGTEDPSETHDPPGTGEVIDWKRKGTAKTKTGASTLLRPEQLITTIQMPGYGLWAARRRGWERVRLSHGYFPEKGSPPRKVTRLHVVRDCERAWEYVEGLARSLKDVVKETSAERVDANLNACDAKGGCPMREICTARREKTLADLFGETAAKEMTVGLIDNLSQIPPPSAPQPDERAALLAEEQALRAAQPAVQAQAAIPAAPSLLSQLPPETPPAPPPAPTIHPLVAVWGAIEKCGRGTPALGGGAAEAYARAHGRQHTPGTGIAGTGHIGAHLTLFEVAKIDQLATELGIDVDAVVKAACGTADLTFVPRVDPVAAAAAAKPVSVIAPDAPASRPELATAGEPKPDASKRGRGRPPATPKVQPEPAAEQAVQTAAAPPPPAPPTPVQAAATQVAPPAQPTPPAHPSSAPVVGSGPSLIAPTVAAMRVYVDCIPSEPSTDLAGYVDKICATLTQRYCVDAQGRPTTQDVRCAPEGSPLGYDGKWGAIRALAKSAPPAVGVYHLRARGDRPREEVSEAMRELIAERGGIYVRGI